MSARIQEVKLVVADFLSDPEPEYPLVFSRKFTTHDFRLKKRACAALLLPKLVEERRQFDRPNIICRKQEIAERVTCDICSTALFTQTWFCQVCGRELCSTCYDNMNHGNVAASICSFSSGVLHTQSEFLPVTRFCKDELDVIISSMTSILEEDISSSFDLRPLPPLPASCEVPRLLPTASVSDFQQHWSQGIPVVVTGVHTRLQGNWSPQYFIDKYGSQKVTLVDCETESTSPSTVSDFFDSFNSPREQSRILKLKDWPPQNHFRDQFPELFVAFMNAVPYGDVCRLDGVLNMAAHFPRNGVAPDLGPKMYIAYSSIEDDIHHGSTKLHIDITDAVNIMVWASPRSEQPGYALWRIFPQAASPSICRFLRDQGFSGPGHPIHSQSVYLTPTMLETLETQYGIRPFTVRQHCGEAVYIPSGCAHQVSNQSDAIKIACDFISIQNLAETERICLQLREHRLATGAGDDVLQLHTTIWHAWRSLSKLSQTCIGVSLDELTDEYPNQPGIQAGHEAHSVANSQMSAKRALRRMKKKQAISLARMLAEPLRRPGYDFRCPLCPRMFHRGGLLDHLKSTHPQHISIENPAKIRLRKPRKVPDVEFMQELHSFLRGVDDLHRSQESGISTVHV